MLQEYKKVLAFLERLEDYSRRKYGKRLNDIEINGVRSCLDVILYDSDYYKDCEECKKELLMDRSKENNNIEYVKAYYKKRIENVELSRSIMEMSDYDLMNLINCIKVSQLVNLILIRYDDERIYNNKLLSGCVFDIYEGVLRECRSIVIDIDKFKVVSLPFYKFMNLNESEDYAESTVLDRLKRANKVEYTNKLDGSFIQITTIDSNIKRFYEYPELLASSQNILETELIKDARKWYECNTNYKLLVRSYPEYTLMFEWISLKDKHVVKYESKDCGLYLIGMRHKKSGRLLSYNEVVEIAEKYSVWHTDIYDMTYEKMRESLYEFKASEKEGYVVNIDGFLVKMKCVDYLNMVRIIKEYGHENAVIKAVSDKRIDEVLMEIPKEYHDRTRITANRLYAYIERIDKDVDDLVEYAIDKKNKEGLGIEEIAEWIKTLPKILRGTIKKKFFNKIKGIVDENEVDYLRNNHTKMLNNYINMAELERREKLLTGINVNDYKTL